MWVGESVDACILHICFILRWDGAPIYLRGTSKMMVVVESGDEEMDIAALLPRFVGDERKRRLVSRLDSASRIRRIFPLTLHISFRLPSLIYNPFFPPPPSFPLSEKYTFIDRDNQRLRRTPRRARR